MITGWRLSPSHNLLHTEGHPTYYGQKITGKKDANTVPSLHNSLTVMEQVVLLSSPPFYRALSRPKRMWQVASFAAFCVTCNSPPNLALPFLYCIYIH